MWRREEGITLAAAVDVYEADDSGLGPDEGAPEHAAYEKLAK
jgi:hypothetical protein